MRHSVLLAMNCKDEPNIREWVLYHSLMGMGRQDHLLIYDDFSTTPVQTVLDTWKWYQEGRFLPRITVIRTHEAKHIYIHKALIFAKAHQLKWLLFIDADEYLYIPERYNFHIHRFLEVVHDEYNRIDGIAFFWRNFGSSDFDTNPSPGQCISVYTSANRQLAATQKTMVRVETAVTALSPHHYAYKHKNPSIYVPMLGNTIPNFPFLRAPRDLEIRDKLHAVFVMHPGQCEFIAHYTHQSWSCFCRRRLRPRDDTGKTRTFPYPLDPTQPGPAAFHDKYNGVHCDLVLCKYLLHLTSWLSSGKESDVEPADGVETPADETPAVGVETPTVGVETNVDETPTDVVGVETPADETPADVVGVETPAVGVETPADETPADVVGVETDVVGVETDVVGVETPADETPTDVVGVETPAVGVETDVVGVETPTDGVETPTDGVETPTDGVETPTDGVETPAASEF